MVLPTRGENAALLKINSGESDTHIVPVDLLVRTLDGLQQIVWLLAASKENRPLLKRFKLSEELRQRYKLLCRIPQDGSYAVPLALPARQLELNYSEFSHHDVLEDVLKLFQAVHEKALHSIKALIPDSRYRDRTLHELLKLVPKPGDLWTFKFAVRDQAEVSVDATEFRSIESWVGEATQEDAVMTVTGDLIRIDFDQYQIVIRYPPTSREIRCYYRPEIEDQIVESRRGPIQVTGQFILDEEGHPMRLTDVTRVEPVDLSIMTFEQIGCTGRVLVLDPPLSLRPTLDEETQQLYIAIEDSLDLHVYAPTREQLADELAEQLLFLWDSYAQEDPSRLNGSARHLRDALLSRVKEQS